MGHRPFLLDLFDGSRGVIALVAEQHWAPWHLFGDADADASNGRISISSPIARTTIGKEEGDVVEVTAPGGARSYEIIKVKY